MGIIAGVLIVSGFCILAATGISGNDSRVMYASICLRAGFTLGAIWLAFPQVLELLAKFPPWLIGLVVLAVGVLVVRPRMIVVIWPLLLGIAVIQFVGWLFKPPKPKSRAAMSKKSTKPKEN